MQKLIGPILVLTLTLLTGTAWAKPAIEDFNTPQTLNDGTVFGSNNHLIARMAAGGSVTIAGGQGTVGFATVADGALIASAQPLPDGPYRIRVAIDSINVAYTPTTDNVAVLLGVYDFAPAVGSAATWNGHGLIEVAAIDESIVSKRVYVTYYDSLGEIFSWDGTAWQQGNSNFSTAFTYATGTKYELVLERTATDFTITVTDASSAVVTSATMPVSAVRAAAGSSYFAIGDPVTDFGYGNIVLDELEAPESSQVCLDGGVDAGQDAGVGDLGSDSAAADVSVSDTSVSDAPPADAAAIDAVVSDAPVASDGPAAGDGPVAGDAAVGDAAIGGDAAVAPPKGCCSTGGKLSPSDLTTAVLMLLIGWPLTGRRRRKRR